MQFSQPFTGVVWLFFFSTVLLTGLVYWLLEARQNDVDFVPDRACSLGMVAHGVTSSFLQLTGGGGFSPKSWPGKLLLASWTWCIVLLLAAYTANLASFLVVQASPVIEFKSLEQAIKRDLKICSHGDILTETAPDIKAMYPNYKFDTSVSSMADLAIKIEERSCDAAITTMHEFLLDMQRSKIKKRCSLEIVEKLRDSSAGYMVISDYSVKCSTLVRDVLNYHLLRMEYTNKLQEIIRTAYDRRAPECAVPEAEPADSVEMGLYDMAGVFLFHGAGVITALVMACFVHVRNTRNSAKEVEGDVPELASELGRTSNSKGMNVIPNDGDRFDKNTVAARLDQIGTGEHVLSGPTGEQQIAHEALQQTLFGIKEGNVQMKETLSQMEEIKNELAQLKDALHGKQNQGHLTELQLRQPEFSGDRWEEARERYFATLDRVSQRESNGSQ